MWPVRLMRGVVHEEEDVGDEDKEASGTKIDHGL